jgi:hypothetical protein
VILRSLRFLIFITIMSSEQPNPRASTFANLSLWLGMFVPWIDIAVCETLGALQPDYHPFTHFISELGEDGRSTQNFVTVWWTCCTLLFLPMCWQLIAASRPMPKLRHIAIGFTVFAVSNGFLNAIFTCDEGCAGHTTSAKLHMFVSGITIVAMILLPIRSANTFLHEPATMLFAKRSKAIAVIIVVLSVVLSAVQLKFDFVPQQIVDVKGLLQRLRGSAFAVWITMLAMSQRKVRGTAQSPS